MLQTVGYFREISVSNAGYERQGQLAGVLLKLRDSCCEGALGPNEVQLRQKLILFLNLPICTVFMATAQVWLWESLLAVHKL